MRARLIIGLLLSVVAGQARANCDGPPHDQFDFWLGAWHDPATLEAERYVVRRTAAGCVVEESLIGADGQIRGLGVSGWDGERKEWRQFWADADGVVRLYMGGPAADGSVVLTSEPEGSGVRWRYTYRNIKPDAVDADYAWSRGEGAPWTTVWSGHYDRVELADTTRK